MYGIAKWEGERWHELDDGSRPALSVAGKFDFARGRAGIPVPSGGPWSVMRTIPFGRQNHGPVGSIQPVKAEDQKDAG